MAFHFAQRAGVLFLGLTTLLAGSAYCEGPQKNFMKGEAVISQRPSGRAAATSRALPANGIEKSLERVYRGSFDSLRRRRLSQYAAKVELERGLVSNDSASAVRFHKGIDPCKRPVIRRLLRSNPSLTCDPNWEVTINQSLTPNDTFYSDLYALGSVGAGRIRAPSAWNITTGSSGVVVAVIDTGVDYTHPDLAGNMWVNPNEIAGDSIDNDGNGYVDDIYGIDARNGDSNPMDDHYHGTHCAGTIGAVGNNGVGIVGVAWNVKIIACKFLSASGSGSIAGAIQCLDYLTNLKNIAGIPIAATSNSWGSAGASSSSLVAAVQRSRDADIVFVAAAGNDGSNNDIVAVSPSNISSSNVIAVAAIDYYGDLASFSNYGATTVDIGAPGVDIYSTSPGNTYRYLSGTSMATPHVTGAIALLKSLDPSLTSTDMISRLTGTGTTLASLSGKTASGRSLNIYNALSTTNPTATPTSTPTQTATPTATFTATPVPPSPTASPTPSPSPTPIETQAPTAVPTVEVTPTSIPPTAVPQQPSPNVGNVRIGISLGRSGNRNDISCKLFELSEDRTERTPLSGYSIQLLDARSKRRALGDSSDDGIASFRITAGRAAESYRCQSTIGGLGRVRSSFVVVRARR